MLLPLLLTLACTDADTSTTDTGTTTAHDLVDADGDGVLAGYDCDDNDPALHQGAEELCDGVDNDCDGAIDEDHDLDGDGHTSKATCDDGTDCDDLNPDVYTGATEVPYDGLDQDCDDLDLTDVDGDGEDSDVVGGTDCNDDDPTVGTTATEVPKDGVDNDCVGGDDLDADDDGHDDLDFGGDDCDDDDPAVNPGAAHDWMYDDVDADCDGVTGLAKSLADAPVSILGTEGWNDLVSHTISVCDFDADGVDDLMLSAPFGQDYQGQIGIFYGAGAAAWNAGMDFSSADVLITGVEPFLALFADCGDLDGDGYADIAAARGEIHLDAFADTESEYYLWYGSAEGWPAALSEDDADAHVVSDLGARTYPGVGPQAGFSYVYAVPFELVDLDGDGADEVLLLMNREWNPDLDTWGTPAADSSMWVIPSGRYEGVVSLEDGVQVRIYGDQDDSITGGVLVPDVDGDGADDLILLQGLYVDEWDFQDQNPLEEDTQGMLALVTSLPVEDSTVAEAAAVSWFAATEMAFGGSVAVGDFDGDGLVDLAVGATADDRVAENAGAVVIFHDLNTLMAGSETDVDTLATAVITNDQTGTFLGVTLLNVGDIDGDGADDLITSTFGADVAENNQILLLHGASLVGEVPFEDVLLQQWTGEFYGDESGLTGNVGDFDGDGAPDLVIGSRFGADYRGAAWIYMGNAAW